MLNLNFHKSAIPLIDTEKHGGVSDNAPKFGNCFNLYWPNFSQPGKHKNSLSTSFPLFFPSPRLKKLATGTEYHNNLTVLTSKAVTGFEPPIQKEHNSTGLYCSYSSYFEKKKQNGSS